MNINVEKVTPDLYNTMTGIKIYYGTYKSKFGDVCLGVKDDSLCFLQFYDDNLESAVSELKNSFPNSTLVRDDGKVNAIAQIAFHRNDDSGLKLLLKGTEFETKVWEQLLSLKEGTTTTYEEVAKALGNPKAIRAVAKAISKNRVAYLVPCHRVIKKSGELSKYKWGSLRKLKLLSSENALKN